MAKVNLLDEHINQRFLLEREQQAAFSAMVSDALVKEPEESLVRYEEEKVIAVQDRQGVFHAKYHKDEEDIKPLFEVTSVYRDVNKRKDSKVDCNLTGLTRSEMRVILNRVFPPQVWRDEDKIYRRNVSLHPASRSETARLQTRLDELITEKNISETGICDSRRKYFDQCFDELARQEIITCLPRGLLLLRIRDEMRQTVRAYESMYLSNAAYGVRKAVKIDTMNIKLQEEFQQLTLLRKTLIENIGNIRSDMQEQSETFQHEFSQAKRLFMDERDYLRRQNQTLKNQLEAIVSSNMEVKPAT